MSGRPRICVFQVPPYDLESTAGGAEVVATDIVTSLELVADVTVLCGYETHGDGPDRERMVGAATRVIEAFPLDDHVWQNGCIEPLFSREARRRLARAHLLITIERSLLHLRDLPTLTCLGGVAYPHAVEVARRGAFDVLVVPSPYVRDQVSALAPDATVSAIINGINLHHFSPSPAGRVARATRLLLATRPELSKGLLRSFALASCLRKSGLDMVLQIAHRTDLPGADDIYDLIRTARGEVPVDLVPWRPRSGMPELYRQADLTLCLSEVPEGFGLTAAESVACGTPVLAHPAGFLADMFPPEHGVFLVAADEPASTWANTAINALTSGADLCTGDGRRYARSHYDITRTRAQYRQLALSLAAQRR